MKILYLFCFSFHAFGGNVPMDVVQFDAQTTDATQTVLYSEVIPDGEVWTVRINCEAVKSDKSKREGFEKIFTVYRDGGNATIEGSPTVVHDQAGTPYAMDIGVDGANSFEILGTGLAAETVKWDRCKRTLEARHK